MTRASLRPALAAATLPLLVAWTAACFSERTTGAGTSGGQCNIPVSVVDSGHVLVAIENFLFAPDSISVPAGTTITWINCEPPVSEPHTTTSASSTPLWDSGEFATGQRYSRAFPTPGVFPYLCTSHSNMNGIVVVQ